MAIFSIPLGPYTAKRCWKGVDLSAGNAGNVTFPAAPRMSVVRMRLNSGSTSMVSVLSACTVDSGWRGRTVYYLNYYDALRRVPRVKNGRAGLFLIAVFSLEQIALLEGPGLIGGK